MTNTLLTDYDYDLLRDQVVKLHYIASVIEQTIGQGTLSADIRTCADRLAELVKRT
jgi:hypothetical protein